jgi:hypothetical protein
VANADSWDVDNGSSIPVLANDYDPDGQLDRGTLVVVREPKAGRAAVNNGAITYFPDSNFEGSDTLRYQICDSGRPNACSQAEVTITR